MNDIFHGNNVNIVVSILIQKFCINLKSFFGDNNIVLDSIYFDFRPIQVIHINYINYNLIL